jgi:hypothetical protein
MNKLTIISCFTMICILSLSSDAAVVKKCTLDSSWSQTTSGDRFTGHKTHEYDANGNKIKSSSFDTNGVLKAYTEWQYDANNYPVKMVMYQKSGTSFTEITRSSMLYNENGLLSIDSTWLLGDLMHINKFYYNADNKNSVDSMFNADGSFSGYDFYEYETNQYTTTSYDSLGQKQGKGVFETNSDGKITKYTSYDKDDVETAHTDYTYDNNGNNIAIKTYNEMGEETGSSVNEYNTDNCLIKSTTTSMIAAFTITTVTNYYYSDIIGVSYFTPQKISKHSIRVNGETIGRLYSIQGKLLNKSIKYSSLTNDRYIPRGLYLFRCTQTDNTLSFPVIVK